MLLLFTSAVPGATQAAKGEKLRLTPEQTIAFHRLQDINWSPDGSSVAFTVTEPPKGTDRPSHVWMYDTRSHEVAQYTNSQKSESRPRFSPDGKVIAFLSDREEFRQIYTMPTHGGEARRLTEGKRSIEFFEWSPDGKQIAFAAPEAKSEKDEQKSKDKDDARVVDRDDKRAWLWLAQADSGKAHLLVGAPWEFSEVAWKPDGTSLVVAATDHPESDQETHRIFLVNPEDGKIREIAAPRGPFGNITISPDGRTLAYVGCRNDGPVPHDLFLMDLAGGSPRNITAKSIDRPVEDYSWSGNDRLLVKASVGFRSRFYEVTPNGDAYPRPDSSMSIEDIGLSKPGNLAFVGETSTRLPEIFVQNDRGEPEAVTHFNQSFADYTLATPEFVHYKSFDGRQVEAAIFKPFGYGGTGKVPTIFLIHGGPTGNYRDGFDGWAQLLSNAGYAVVLPNVRGSTGYGYEFMILNRGDWGGGDFKDVMAGVDYVVSTGLADPDRLGIAGWSYGGYMAEWAITQTNRFKAAVSGAGLADLAAEFGTEDHPSYDEWFYGLPYEKPAGFQHSSPITHIKNARTPTLILQGEADVIDPMGQSQQLYRGLKRYGVETELVLYPREGHGLKEEKHLVDRLNRITAWFDKHLK